MNRATFQLFKKKPSFLSGVAAIIHSAENYRYSKGDADAEALNADWNAIGNDMTKAIQNYAAESRKSSR